jgi:hypothetical protein
MAIPIYPILRRELETALWITVSLSSGMATEEVMCIGVLLREAATAMGDIVAERNNSATDGNIDLLCTILRTLTKFPMFPAPDDSNHPSASRFAAALHAIDTASHDSHRNRVSFSRPSTRNGPASFRANRGSTRRPAPQNTLTSHRNAATQAPRRWRRNRNSPIPVIDIQTDSDNE